MAEAYESKSVLDGSESDSEIVSNIEAKVSWFMRTTRDQRRQWLINSAFARGQQFSVLHRNDDRLIQLQAPGKRKQVMDDMIGPWVEHTVANMVTAMPEFEGVPANMDPDSVRSARVATGLLAYYRGSKEWSFTNQYVMQSTNVVEFGNAFSYLNYLEDGTKTTALPQTDPETGEQLMGDDGEFLFEVRVLGDVTRTVLDPQSVLFPMSCDSIEDEPWVIIRRKRTLDYLCANYANGGDIKSESIDSNEEFGLHNIRGTHDRYDNGGTTEYANETIYLQKPCVQNRSGMVAVTAGGVLLKFKQDMNSRSNKAARAYKSWPFKHLTTYPITHFYWRKEPGEAFARSPIERQIPIQKAVNLCQSILAENIDDMAHIKTLVPNQSGVSDITDMNDIVRYNHPYAPAQMALAPLPAYVENYVDRLKAAMRDVQNFHGASLGGSVSGVRSDVHAQNLQEQDLMPLSVIDELMQAAFQREAEKVLLIAAEKLSTERTVSYVGQDKRTSVMTFKGDMLSQNPRVSVRMANKLMRSKTSTLNNIMQMFQMGGITDQYGRPDPIKYQRLIEFALPDSAFSDLRVHTDRAYNENDRLMRGENPPVTEWQNHRVDMDVHQDWMNGPEFMQLYEDAMSDPSDPNQQPKDMTAARIVMAFQQHVALHGQYIAMAMQAFAPANNGSQSNEGTRGTSGQGQGQQQGKGQSAQQA